jgi:hypothetical protein
MIIDTKNNMDKLFKWLTSLALVAFLVAVAIITFYFINTWGPISSNQNDWASLGSLLSGVFSFLGAIGTIGVMVLGLYQFKELKKQTDEISMLNHFEMFTKHNQIFSDFLVHVESKVVTYYSMPNHFTLYKKIYPNNSIKNLSFQHDEEFINTLKLEYQALITRFEEDVNDVLVNDLVNFEGTLSLGRRNNKSNIILKTESGIGCLAPLEIAHKLYALGHIIGMIHEFLDIEPWNKPSIDTNKITFSMEDYIVANMDSNLVFNIDSLDKLVLKLLNKFKHYLTDGTMNRNEDIFRVLCLHGGLWFKETVDELNDESNLLNSVFNTYHKSGDYLPQDLHDMYNQCLSTKNF